MVRNLILGISIAAGCALLALPQANAFELTGAWATDADKCTKVFARKGRANQVGFTAFPGVHGGGFVAEVDRLRSKAQICKIKSKKESDLTVNLIVACASGIMSSDVQFFLKIVDAN